MKIKELIKYLSTLDEDLSVSAVIGEDAEYCRLMSIEEVTYIETVDGHKGVTLSDKPLHFPSLKVVH